MANPQTGEVLFRGERREWAFHASLDDRPDLVRAYAYIEPEREVDAWVYREDAEHVIRSKIPRPSGDLVTWACILAANAFRESLTIEGEALGSVFSRRELRRFLAHVVLPRDR